MRRPLLGSENKDVAVTLVELARVFNDGGRDDEAEPAIRESLAIRLKVFGEEHQETATSKSELGRLLMRRGDLADAEPLLRENVVTTVHVLGADHPNSAAAKSTLGLLLLAKGDLRGGEALLRESLALNRRIFGTRGLEYAQALNSLAIAEEWQGHLGPAQSLFEEALQIAQPQLGGTHTRVQTYLVNLARVRIARGDGAATASPLRDVLTARETLYPPGNWRVAQAQSLLAAALMAQKRYADAEPLMVAADGGLRSVGGIEGRERAANRARLAIVRQTLRRPEQAGGSR